MNTEIFFAVLSALVLYRLLSPLIDAINLLSLFGGAKIAPRTEPVAFGEPFVLTEGFQAQRGPSIEGKK